MHAFYKNLRGDLYLTIKQKLQRYAYVLEQAKDLEIRIAEIRGRMSSISSTQFDAIPGGHGNSDKIGDTIARLCNLEARYIDIIGKLAEEELEINNLIAALDTEEQLIIRLRYINRKRWTYIQDVFGCSRRSIYRMHSSIIKKLENNNFS